MKFRLAQCVLFFVFNFYCGFAVFVSFYCCKFEFLISSVPKEVDGDATLPLPLALPNVWLVHH